MYRALYRTWRPQTFDDVCGQERITDILKYQVSQGKTSHAYLFCGSRGTGKTTCAKILAKAVNCLHPVNGNPCNECEACRAIDAGHATDVIEMDAASNNGVDHVRDLKEEIVFMPAELNKRVYIIDEVHMMSAGAFNALLKTLEEPPSYVLFILATTELSKLPSTIISRCQRCDFRRIDTEVIMGRLAQIAKAEGMTLCDDGARMIARAAQGGMRDAVSLLELCGGAHAPIDETLVTSVLGVGDRITHYKVLEAVSARDYETLYKTVDDIAIASGDLGGFWSGLGDVIRDLIVVKTIAGYREYLDLTDSESEKLASLASQFDMARLFYMSHTIYDILPTLTKTGIARRASVEVALTRMCDPRLSVEPEALLARIETLEKTVKMLRHAAPSVSAPSAPAPASATVSTPAPVAPIQAVEEKQEDVISIPLEVVPEVVPQEAPKEAPSQVGGWRQVLEDFGEIYPHFKPILPGSKASIKDGKLVIYMRDHLFVNNFQSNKKALEALVSMVVQETGKEITDCVIERIKGEQIDVPTDETFF
jgi:DNA polymerase-3 subunit gamma/tau